MRYDTPHRPVMGPAGQPQLWTSPLEGPGNRPVHLALAAPSRDAAEAVFATAQQAGAEILHEPHEWPEYHPDSCGVFLRDPDGNNGEAVHHGFPAA